MMGIFVRCDRISFLFDESNNRSFHTLELPFSKSTNMIPKSEKIMHSRAAPTIYEAEKNFSFQR